MSNYTAEFIADDIVDGCECCALNMEDNDE
jgi:hypothetical protein